MPVVIAFVALRVDTLCPCRDSGVLTCVVGVLLLDLDTEGGLKGSEALLWPVKPRRALMREPGRNGAIG